MENVEGQSLYDLVTRSGPLSPSRTITIALDILDALGEAHALKIIHRDVRPPNVVVGDRRTTLVDFSLGADRKLVVSPTREGDSLGDWEYAAPEQKADASKADPRCDFYSLGCTIRFMLSGAASVDSGTRATPLAVQGVVDRATALKPEERYCLLYTSPSPRD